MDVENAVVPDRFLMVIATDSAYPLQFLTIESDYVECNEIFNFISLCVWRSVEYIVNMHIIIIDAMS